MEREGTAAANLQRGPCPVFQVARLQTDPPHRPPPSAAALGLGLGFGLGLGLGLGFGFGFGFRLAVPAAFASAATGWVPMGWTMGWAHGWMPPRGLVARHLTRRVAWRVELQRQLGQSEAQLPKGRQALERATEKGSTPRCTWLASLRSRPRPCTWLSLHPGVTSTFGPGFAPSPRCASPAAGAAAVPGRRLCLTEQEANTEDQPICRPVGPQFECGQLHEFEYFLARGAAAD